MKLRESIKALDAQGTILATMLICSIFKSGEQAATESSYIVTGLNMILALAVTFAVWFILYRIVDLIAWLWIKFVRKPRLEEEAKEAKPEDHLDGFKGEYS